jgi:hypothetical protein
MRCNSESAITAPGPPGPTVSGRGELAGESWARRRAAHDSMIIDDHRIVIRVRRSSRKLRAGRPRAAGESLPGTVTVSRAQAATHSAAGSGYRDRTVPIMATTKLVTVA